jgi:hypothetical protein
MVFKSAYFGAHPISDLANIEPATRVAGSPMRLSHYQIHNTDKVQPAVSSFRCRKLTSLLKSVKYFYTFIYFDFEQVPEMTV